MATKVTTKVAVVDSGNDRIQVFNTDGKFIRKWETSGEGDGKFRLAMDICHGSRLFYITDAYKDCVQVFMWLIRAEYNYLRRMEHL